jgi:hypothetical protein
MTMLCQLQQTSFEDLDNLLAFLPSRRPNLCTPGLRGMSEQFGISKSVKRQTLLIYTTLSGQFFLDVHSKEVSFYAYADLEERH